MHLHIAPSDMLPIYRQLIHQISDAIASGRLQVGQRLPSQRQLAEQLVISPHSIRKAYAELRSDGVIDIHPGLGSFVKATRAALDPDERRRRMSAAARRLLVQARLTGLALPEVHRLLAEVDQELGSERDCAGTGTAGGGSGAS
jgi:GntR family transcriptional regulator